jgi:hypothetical protein
MHWEIFDIRVIDLHLQDVYFCAYTRDVRGGISHRDGYRHAGFLKVDFVLCFS